MIVVANVFPKLQTVKILVRPLSKKHRFRPPFISQYVKASQILAKSPWEHFNHVFSSFSTKLIWKMYPLLLGEIFGLFVNILTADDKYSVKIAINLQLPFQIQLRQKRETFCHFLLHFCNLHEILNILREIMIVIANIFSKLQTVKTLLRPLSKKLCLRTHFDSQHVKGSQILLKYPWECFYHVFSAFSGKFIFKTSPLVLGEMLEVFVNILTAEDKYPVQDWENLQLTIQMLLPEKGKAFCNFLSHFWNLHEILNILKEKMFVIANAFPKLQTVKILVRPLSKTRRFKTRFDSQHVKVSQILVKYPWDCFYHVLSSFSRKLILKKSPLVLGAILGVFVKMLIADEKYPAQNWKNMKLPIKMQLSENWKIFC